MKPVEFEAQTTVYAKDQPQYLPLPAHRTENGIVTSCWELSDIEIERIVKTRRVWLQAWTFNGPLQPARLSVAEPPEIARL